MILTINSQFQLDLTPCLGGITLESLQQGHHFCLAFLLCLPNGISLVDIPWFPKIDLSPRSDPPPDDVKVAITSSPKEWNVSGVVGLVYCNP